MYAINKPSKPLLDGPHTIKIGKMFASGRSLCWIAVESTSVASCATTTNLDISIGVDTSLSAVFWHTRGTRSPLRPLINIDAHRVGTIQVAVSKNLCFWMYSSQSLKYPPNVTEYVYSVYTNYWKINSWWRKCPYHEHCSPSMRVFQSKLLGWSTKNGLANFFLTFLFLLK